MAHWVTPPAVTSEDKATAIGEINYGTESRMFVFAYRDADSQSYVIDTSIPAYNKLVDFTSDELDQYIDAKYIVIQGNDLLVNETTEVPLKYNHFGVTKDTGLRIASNGQIVGRLTVSDPLREIVFKVRYQDPPKYTIDTAYRAYSHVHYNRRLYRLNTGVTLPFRAETGAPDPEFWTDIGEYTPQYVPVDAYVHNAEYVAGDYVRYESKLYQLTSRIETYAKAYTNDPDMTRWRLRDLDNVYIPAKHNPDLAYVPGNTYNAPAGTDIYVNYNNSSYKMNDTVDRPYVAPVYDGSDQSTLAPNPEAWSRVSDVIDEPYTKNKIYKLSDVVYHTGRIYVLGSVKPFKGETTEPDVDFWNDLGEHKSNGTNTSDRIFRIVINTRKSSLIEFQTPSGLGSIKIGEQLGDHKIKDIIASPDQLVTYEVPEKFLPRLGESISAVENVYPYVPPGLTVQADGTVSGRPIGPTGQYRFEVIASNINGLAKSQEFDLRVIEGYEPNTVSVKAYPSRELERDWYNMIADSTMNNLQLYRPSDPNYGIRPVPEILLKDNIKCEYSSRMVSDNAAMALLDSKLVSGPITCRIGNMRYRTALDEDGKALYEILYKELVPLSVDVSYNANAEYEPTYSVTDLFQLKTTIVSLLNSDDENLTHPLRAFTITGAKMYVDSLPLWQTNPQQDFDAKAGPRLVIPVAYVKPGQASKFISDAMEAGVLKNMLVNTIITIDTLTLKRHSDPFDKVKRILLKNV